MKAEDLMIGDWVKCTDPKCEGHQVDLIDLANEEVGLDGKIDNFENIIPIPLTTDILEKNGFEVSSEHARYYFKEEDEKYEFVLRKMYYINNPKVQKGWAFYAFNVLTLVDYVHELQHALKLCRIEKEIIL